MSNNPQIPPEAYITAEHIDGATTQATHRRPRTNTVTNLDNHHSHNIVNKLVLLDAYFI
jgi:hypothetical protein